MSSLAQDYTLATSASFKQAVEMAIMRRLMALLATPANLSSDQLAVARSVIYDPAPFAALIARAVATEGTIAARNGVEANVTDAEIMAAVNTVIGRFVR